MTREIQLTQGLVALVDEEDHDALAQHRWHAARIGNTWYAMRTVSAEGRRRSVTMHSQLLEVSDQVDHANGDGLDNRRGNLRLTDHQGNSRNARRHSHSHSQFKGVRATVRGRFQARITIDGRQRVLGRFDTQEEAARAYDAAAREAFGFFARPNFPDHEATHP